MTGASRLAFQGARQPHDAQRAARTGQAIAARRGAGVAGPRPLAVPLIAAAAAEGAHRDPHRRRDGRDRRQRAFVPDARALCGARGPDRCRRCGDSPTAPWTKPRMRCGPSATTRRRSAAARAGTTPSGMCGSRSTRDEPVLLQTVDVDIVGAGEADRTLRQVIARQRPAGGRAARSHGLRSAESRADAHGARPRLPRCDADAPRADRRSVEPDRRRPADARHRRALRVRCAGDRAARDRRRAAATASCGSPRASPTRPTSSTARSSRSRTAITSRAWSCRRASATGTR